MTHLVPNVGARPDNFCRDRTDRIRQRSAVSVWSNPPDGPSPHARRLFSFSNGLFEDQAVLAHPSDAIDANVNGFAEQLVQIAFPVRVALEECNWIELCGSRRWKGDAPCATAGRS